MMTISELPNGLFYAWVRREQPYIYWLDSDGKVTHEVDKRFYSRSGKEKGRHVLAIGSTEQITRKRGDAVLNGRMK